MCATQTCSSVLAVSAPPQGRWKGFGIMEAMTVVVEAFREALDMRRVAQRSHFLGDE